MTYSPTSSLTVARGRLKERYCGPCGPNIEAISAGDLNAMHGALLSFNNPDRVIQQSNTDTESVLHLTLLWEAITLAQARQLYLIYKLPALSSPRLAQQVLVQSICRGWHELENLIISAGLRYLARSKVQPNAALHKNWVISVLVLFASNKLYNVCFDVIVVKCIEFYPREMWG